MGLRKIIIFGNSGSGKSTLAKQLCAAEQLAHLDLDTLAWAATTPPQRRPLSESTHEIREFIDAHQAWVIEGCYTDLLELVLRYSNELIFLNLPTEACVANAKLRPWEPHKYQSKQAQDANLEMLIDWIGQYTQRVDTFSEQSHQALFDAFEGKKAMYHSNQSNTLP